MKIFCKNINIPLLFSHPIKYFIWVIKDKNLVNKYGVIYSKSNGLIKSVTLK